MEVDKVSSGNRRPCLLVPVLRTRLHSHGDQRPASGRFSLLPSPPSSPIFIYHDQGQSRSSHSEQSGSGSLLPLPVSVTWGEGQTPVNHRDFHCVPSFPFILPCNYLVNFFGSWFGVNSWLVLLSSPSVGWIPVRDLKNIPAQRTGCFWTSFLEVYLQEGTYKAKTNKNLHLLFPTEMIWGHLSSLKG